MCVNREELDRLKLEWPFKFLQEEAPPHHPTTILLCSNLIRTNSIMGNPFKKIFGRSKEAESEAASTAEGTVVLGADAIPLSQEPELYSTKGSIGIRVVVEPSDADLEYVQNPDYFIQRRVTDGVP